MIPTGSLTAFGAHYARSLNSAGVSSPPFAAISGVSVASPSTLSTPLAEGSPGHVGDYGEIWSSWSSLVRVRVRDQPRGGVRNDRRPARATMPPPT
jgi:hypothetical protein